MSLGHRVLFRAAPRPRNRAITSTFLPLLETMLELVLLRLVPSAHFGKQLHRAELVGARVGIWVPWHRRRQTAAARSSLASTCPGIEFLPRGDGFRSFAPMYFDNEARPAG